MNLLIVDDEPLEREVLTMIIAREAFAGTNCFEAHNGMDAVKIAKQHPIDIAILDIKMPIMNGVTAARIIRAERPECRMIFLTAYEKEEYAEKGLEELGAEAYLLKPAHPKEVVQTLRRFLPVHIHNQVLHTRREESDPIRTIKEYIQRYIAEELSLERLSEVVHLHPQYVSRLFKQKAGITLTDYISQMRLEKAKELLAGTNLSMAQIGERCGLLDPNYFSRLFRKYEGITPTQYRKRQKAEPTLPLYQFQRSLF